MSTQQISEKYLSPAWYYDAPLEIVKGEGVHLIDVTGKRYLDFVSGYGVTSTGHCHPKVVEAVRRQAGELVHVSTVVMNQVTVKLAERLAGITPPGLDMMFFSVSGSDAIEAAIKMSRRATGRTDIIAFQGAFHGRTTGATAITSSKVAYRRGYAPFMPGVYIAPYATPFRCPAGGSRENCAEACLTYLDKMFIHQVDPSRVAAMFVEPILGEGGYINPPVEFLQGLRQRCDEHGILLVTDEIQSGVGRSGKWWAHQHAGITPDLMTVAKGIASGYPLSALVGKREILSQWQPGAHGTTYGGNPVSCAAALATLDVIEEEGLIENAAQRGEQLQAGLRELQTHYPIIGDVRGKGLMTGIEFIKDGGSPNPEAAKAVQKRVVEGGAIISPCGPYGQSLRMSPPLTVTTAQVDEFLDIFRAAVDAVAV